MMATRAMSENFAVAAIRTRPQNMARRNQIPPIRSTFQRATGLVDPAPHRAASVHRLNSELACIVSEKKPTMVQMRIMRTEVTR